MKRVLGRGIKARGFSVKSIVIAAGHPRCFGYRCQLQQSNGTRTTNNAFTAILPLACARHASIKICFMRENFYQIAQRETAQWILNYFRSGDIR